MRERTTKVFSTVIADGRSIEKDVTSGDARSHLKVDLCALLCIAGANRALAGVGVDSAIGLVWTVV